MTIEAQSKKILPLDSSYLDDYRNAIRSKSLPWEGFARSGLISQEDSTVLTELEFLTIEENKKKTPSNEEELTKFVDTIVRVLGNDQLPTDRTDVLKFNLVALSDLLNENGNREFITTLSEKGLIETGLKALERYVKNNDEVIKLLAIYDSILLLINFKDTKGGEYYVESIINELLKLLKVQNFYLKFLAINLISELLLNSNKQFRSVFWSKHELLLPVLFSNLHNDRDQNDNNNSQNISKNDLIQLHYRTLLIIWILSFDNKKKSIFRKLYLNDLLSLLNILKISIKEKIIRLIISIFINLTDNVEQDNESLEIVKFLILNGEFVPTLKNLKERKWSDDELIADLESISETSSTIFDKLTSFDEYLQELNLKTFKNSPVHFKEEFFIDNLIHFQDSNYKNFNKLIDILDDEQSLSNSNSLKILLSDLEKILKIDSGATKILLTSNKKAKIMNLLNHKNSEVRYQALKITQLLVSQSLK